MLSCFSNPLFRTTINLVTTSMCRVRFILAVISGELVISKRKKIEIVQDLLRQKYTPFPKQSKKSLDEEEEEKEDEDVKSEVDAKAADFDYLLSMPLWSLTFERVSYYDVSLRYILTRFFTLSSACSHKAPFLSIPGGKYDG